MAIEDTQTKVEKENEQLIEEMLANAEKADEPGELVKNPVIHRGDGDVPSPMVMSSLKSAGHSRMWDTKTGVESLTNNNMLATQLKKMRPDGTRVYTTTKPLVAPKRGDYKCLLHIGDPNRKHYDDLGLAVCPKDNLNSPFQVRRHMEKRHKTEWAAIEQERTDREKKEDRDFQKQLMSRALGETRVTEEAPLYISRKDREKIK